MSAKSPPVPAPPLRCHTSQLTATWPRTANLRQGRISNSSTHSHTRNSNINSSSSSNNISSINSSNIKAQSIRIHNKCRCKRSSSSRHRNIRYNSPLLNTQRSKLRPRSSSLPLSPLPSPRPLPTKPPPTPTPIPRLPTRSPPRCVPTHLPVQRPLPHTPLAPSRSRQLPLPQHRRHRPPRRSPQPRGPLPTRGTDA